MLGRVGPDELSIETVHRFANDPVRTPDGLHWSVLELYRELVEGLAVAARAEPELRSIGIDSWAVDYALLRDGRLLGEPYSYRDERNEAGVEAVHARVSPAELYSLNGLQHLPFNTLFQLTADRLAGTVELADSFLLIPDLFASWLSGQSVAEYTNASTTGLVGVADRAWDTALIERLGLPQQLFRLSSSPAPASVGSFPPPSAGSACRRPS